EIIAEMSEIAEAARQRARSVGAGAGEILVVQERTVETADAAEIIARRTGRLLQLAHHDVPPRVQRHFLDDDLHERLGEDRVEFLDDLLDHRHVLFAGENEQRIRAFVRDDFGRAEDVEVTSAAAAGALQAKRFETIAERRGAIVVTIKAGAQSSASG